MTIPAAKKQPEKLFAEYLPALQGKGKGKGEQHIVLLHGWGIASDVWSGMVPLLSNIASITLVDLPGFGGSEHVALDAGDDWLEAIMAVVPERAVYCGFSLGGMLAMQLASRFPGRVSGVVTIASNARFVATEDWSTAMAAQTFDSFYQLAQQQPDVALKRFAALQAKGCGREREVLKQLKNLMGTTIPSTEGLMNGLAVLAGIDNRTTLNQLTCPALHIFGEVDQLVPVAAAQAINERAGVSLAIVEGASHVPFISHRDQCYSIIKHFLEKESLLPAGSSLRRLDKRQVARSFSRAAQSYDTVAILQRRVGEALLNTVPGQSSKITVDLGCGTGFYLQPLANKLGGTVIAFDLAEGMTRYVKQRNHLCSCVCGDAEAIPLADASVDVIFSSLAIQWCEDNRALFMEIQRVLKPGGKMFFSTLGPETLFELRQAWSVVDDYVHVNRFTDRQSLQQAVSDAGFAKFEMSEEMISLEYPQLKHLTRELKGIGAHNVNEGRPAGLTGRLRIKQLLAAYESQRNERGMLPATYQVWYGALQK